MKSHLIENTVSRSLKLVESKEHRKGCIGRLEGICADFKNPTRNGRLYGLKLWQNVFNNALVKEALETKTLFGELDHPEERFEVLAKLACVVMTDYKINEDEGTVTGGFDILDTVQGRTLKALLDYGSQMGVSSRGTGDIIDGSNGEEVDPDTYDFACFDVVSTPAVATARQTVVESINQKTKKKALLESINSEIKQASVIELQAIKNTVTKSKVPNLDSVLESIEDREQSLQEGKTISSNKLVDSVIPVVETTKTIRGNNGAIKETIKVAAKLNSKVIAYKNREKATAKMIENLKAQVSNLTTQLDNTKNKLNKQVKESVKQSRINSKLNKELAECKSTLTECQSKLSQHSTKLIESNQKVKLNQNDLTDKQKQIAALEKLNKNYATKLDDVQTTSESKIAELTERLQNSLSAVSKLTNEKQKLVSEKQKLSEQLNSSSDIIQSYKDKQTQLKNTVKEQQLNSNSSLDNLTEKYNKLADDYNTLLNESNNMSQQVNNCNQVIDSLNKQLTESKHNATKQINNLTESVNKINKLNRAYMTSYLTECANKQGINPKLIKLTESTTPNEIKQLINEEVDRQDRYNKLPISPNAPTKVNVLNESISDNTLSTEEHKTISFLEQVQGTI